MDDVNLKMLRARKELRDMMFIREREPIPFSPSRFPYTYACDLVRNEVASLDSRAEASAWIRDKAHTAGLPHEHVAEMLALAYMRRYNIQIPNNLKEN